MNFHYSTALQRPLPPSKSPKSQQLNRRMLQVKQVLFVYSGWVTNTDTQHFLIRSVNDKLFHNSLICMDLKYTPPPSQTCLTTVRFDQARSTALPSDGDDDKFLSFLNAVQKRPCTPHWTVWREICPSPNCTCESPPAGGSAQVASKQSFKVR